MIFIHNTDREESEQLTLRSIRHVKNDGAAACSAAVPTMLWWISFFPE